MDEDKKYTSLAEYFEEHPEEENEFYDDMATLAMVEDGIIDYPEDWVS